jgi:putative SOS response-associated peptidase YedK
LWTTWTGRRGTKANPVEGEHTLFGFLTCEPNGVVGAVHPKAMPVILTTATEIEQWMTAPAEEALKLQRPLQDGVLKVVARGEREDGAVRAGMSMLQCQTASENLPFGSRHRSARWLLSSLTAL